jgi:GNAT superfamily N-acetyltransferase
MTDLLVRLYDLPALNGVLDALKAEGVIVRRAMAYEKHLVVEWVQEHFDRGWASECDVSFSNQPISCVIATELGEILGFACYDGTCRGFFGPTGVAEARRGRGIGTGLLLACLHSMRAAGYAYAIIGGVGPVSFYARTVGAIEIPGSTPGIYRDMLTGASD